MHEQFTKLTGEVRGSLRFRWYGMALAWVVCITGWAVVAWMPDVYEASARIYVDTSSDIEPVLRDQMVASDVQAELSFVRESLLGTDRLDLIARTVGLDASAVTPLERQRVVTRLADDIDISTQTSLVQDNIYLISYRNVDRDKAIAVVSALHDGLIDGTHNARLAGSATAEGFLEDAIAAAEAELSRLDQERADFKRANSDRLPGAAGDYFTRMINERDLLASRRSELQVAQAKRDRLREQLSGQTPLLDAPRPAGVVQDPNSTEARIGALRAEIDTMLEDLTEANPSVIAKRETLSRLEAQLAAEREALAVSGAQSAAAAAANPVYAAAQIALNEAEVEISTLQAAIAQSEGRLAELQGKIDEIPQIEAQMEALDRGYEVKEAHYNELVSNQQMQSLTTQANLADQIEFVSLNPPDALLTPVAPRRALLLAGVFIAALGAGGALSFLLAKLFPVVGSVRALQALTELPVLGTVTQAWEASFRQQRRRAVVAFAGSFGALLVAFVVVAAIELMGGGIGALLRGGGA